ncbi:MAG: hypothetical protein K0S75_1408 [Clostridia bacterium]|jgi:uncharacterized protein (DUF58 family)|nr:hypothetical protein [Clostridia bacterium]
MSSLLFIILIALLVVIQGILYKRSIFEKIYITRSFDNVGVFPGEKVAYELAIENRKFLPLTWVSIDEKLYTGLEFEISTKVQKLNEDVYLHNCMFSLLPYQKIIRKYDLKAVKRGYYQLKYMTMTSTNMLGTEEYSVEREEPAIISVYPNIVDLRGTLIPANTTQGDFSVKRWIIEDPMVITGVRAYSGNDSLKSVNWKATAKNQQLLVNKYDYTADKKIMIILNLERQEYSLNKEDIQTIEEAIEVCASIASMMQETGIPVGFATNSHMLGPSDTGVLDPDTGDKHMTGILDSLARISYFKKFKSRELLKLLVTRFSWGTEIIVVTPEVSEELIGDLQSLNNIKTTVISLSKSDVDVPSNINLFYYKLEGAHYEAI